MKILIISSLTLTLAIAAAPETLRTAIMGDRATATDQSELLSRGGTYYQNHRYQGGTGRREILSHTTRDRAIV